MTVLTSRMGPAYPTAPWEMETLKDNLFDRGVRMSSMCKSPKFSSASMRRMSANATARRGHIPMFQPRPRHALVRNVRSMSQ